MVSPHTRRRSIAVAAPIAAMLVASGMAGCGASDPAEDPDYAAVCADETGKRVDDSECERAGVAYDNNTASNTYIGPSPLFWYFVGRGSAVPPVGGFLSPGVGTRTLPNNATIGRGFPRTGGTVTRGGFGKGGAKGFVGTGSKSGAKAGGKGFGG